jgi:formate hydrogenlyase transcriptional activator
VSLCLELEQLLPKILSSLRGIARYERSELSILDESGLQLCIYGEMPAGEPLRRPVSYPVAASLSAKTIETQSVVSYGAADLRDGDDSVGKALYDSGIRSVCSVPLLAGNRIWGALNLHSVKEKAFDPASVEYLQQVANQIGAALERARAADEIAQLKERLAPVRSRQKYESKAGRLNPNIVGTSLALQRVLEYAAIVADTDSTVLLTGETGTGKERIARLIHTMSRRKDRNFIKLNCAAIPTGLLESELFGHEKGAFTGAVSQKLGRLELADQGTLLLDEIGEIPLELQPKLLRVLQDQDFERLGGTKTIHVDVRLIAATNRDLARAVENKEFRGDLFYRLHVFPLHLPALRERREDIPELVRHYVEICSARLQKPMEAMPEEVLSVLMNWNWPGNIRELENFIERSVILSDGTWQNAPLRELRAGSVAETPDPDGSLRERERSHIIEILRQTRGALSGPGGAAARLGLKRTTLQYKMQRLGIARTDYLQ